MNWCIKVKNNVFNIKNIGLKFATLYYNRNFFKYLCYSVEWKSTYFNKSGGNKTTVLIKTI